MSSLRVIFVWGGVAIFCRFEFGPKQSVKLLQNMVYNTTQHYPPPPKATHCLYIMYVYSGRGGGGQRDGRGATVHKRGAPMRATVHKLGRKYQPWVNVSPVYKICLTHAAKSVNRSILKKSRHLVFGVLIVHSSMPSSSSLTMFADCCGLVW
jgi:hypothetical protein